MKKLIVGIIALMCCACTDNDKPVFVCDECHEVIEYKTEIDFVTVRDTKGVKHYYHKDCYKKIKENLVP